MTETEEIQAKYDALLKFHVPSQAHEKAQAEALKAEIEGLRRDAERYRWLSRKHNNPVEKDWYVYGATGPFLSNSVDAAMAKEQEDKCAKP